jgi:GNAT superfamily N-acetyltransferase
MTAKKNVHRPTRTDNSAATVNEEKGQALNCRCPAQSTCALQWRCLLGPRQIDWRRYTFGNLSMKGSRPDSKTAHPDSYRSTAKPTLEYTFTMTLTHWADTLSALVNSLRFDPFYAAISQNFADDEARRRDALARYFDYSMSEGTRLGRVVVWPVQSVGAAVWLLPVEDSELDRESEARAAFLSHTMGTRGADAYRRIIDFMKPRAYEAVDESAWYLSIVGVAPSAQSQGIGTRLIAPTLAEADDAGVECYLETFDSRNLRFYQRLGFSALATHVEPVTAATYTIMSRHPMTKVRSG